MNVIVMEACGSEPEESPDHAMCTCGHRRTAHTFSDDGVPLAFGGSNCEECWDCPRFSRA